MSLVPYLRAKLGPLRVTELETRFSMAFDGAIVLPPRLAWAAELAELDCVEVRCPERRVRMMAHVFFGRPSVAQLWAGAGCAVHTGDTLHLAAFAWRRRDDTNPHHATRVLVGAKNAPIEIRRITAREAKVDPSYLPLPPRTERAIPIPTHAASNTPEGAMA